MEKMNIFDEDNKEYYLMNKDIKILKFKLEKGYLDSGVFTEVARHSELLPIGFTNISIWIETRRAPKNRANIEILLKQCGCDTLEGFINVTYALSLTDTFWVRPLNSKLNWDKVSLFRNDFNDEIARIAFEGGLYGLGLPSTSPEYGTNGMFPKCWQRNKYNGETFLLKGGSSGVANAGLEPYSEFYASQIAKIVCIDSVEYGLRKFKDRLVCDCKLFTSEENGYASIATVLGGQFTTNDIFSYYNSINSLEDFRSMLVLDALILNTDRHAGNHGILFDTDTLKPIKMAPVFDNNLSLLCYAMKSDFDKGISDYISTRYPIIGDNFITTAKAVLTPRLRNILVNMKGFKFERHPKYNLAEWRLIELEKVINNQIKLILQ